jgi:hypothetical protein
MTKLRPQFGVGLLLVALGACKTTNTVGYPAEYVSMKGPGHVWVTESDKSVIELYNPQIKGENGDTLVGFLGKSGTYFEMPLSDVKLMRAPEISMGRTMLFAGTIAIGSALLLTQVTGTNGPANVCFLPGAGNNGLPLPCPKPAITTDLP